VKKRTHDAPLTASRSFFCRVASLSSKYEINFVPHSNSFAKSEVKDDRRELGHHPIARVSACRLLQRVQNMNTSVCSRSRTRQLFFVHYLFPPTDDEEETGEGEAHFSKARVGNSEETMSDD